MTADSPTWSLFIDWCAAAGEDALPAAPLTLARFLDAHPATAATQRRRVGALNAAHRRHGFTPPGRSQLVRDLLDQRARTRRQQRARDAAAAISRLPGTGWPTMLFARRDAMILVLAGSGLTATAIAALRLGDVREAQDELLEVDVAGDTRIAGADLARSGICPAEIWRNWESVRRVQYRLPSTRWVAQLLGGARMPAISPASPEEPLVTPLDQWGAAPLPAEPLSAVGVAEIISTNLQGRPTVHRPIQKHTTSATPDGDGLAPVPTPEPVVLDPGAFDRGLDARRRGAELLSGVDADLDDVEARADALLAGLLELLEDPES